MDLESLIVGKSRKPELWGERTPEWEILDRTTIMALLSLVRERYLKKCREHFIEALGSDDAEFNRACMAVLQAVREDTLDLLAGVPDDLFTTKPEGEKWSYHDLVNHLATDEHGEFFPGPPDSILHRIKTDCVHFGQLRRFMRKDKLLPPANHFDQ